MLDTRRLADTLVSGAKTYIDKQLSGILERIGKLEARAPEKGEKGEAGPAGASGKDGVGLADIIREADGNLVAVMSDGRTKAIGNIAVRDGIDGRDGVDGKDGINGQDGRDGIDGEPGKDGADGKDGEPGADGKDGRDGVDGKDVDMDAVRTMIDEAVAAAIAEVPVPKDGRDGVDGKNGRDGINGKDGADGVGLAGAMQDAEGNLVITDTKGGVHNVGRVRGIDGQNGKDGERGADGFSLTDFDAKLADDCRTLVLSFERGDTSYNVELDFPAPIYRGVFKDGQEYERGDFVTFGGGVWHCNESTTEKPETTKAWTLAVKRGRDGKNGVDGERGMPGPEGKPGRDLTQLGPDGAKW